MSESARIVIECEPAPDGFVYRVWTVHNGRAFGLVEYPLYLQAIGEVMAKAERGELTPFEPGFE